MLCGNEHFRVNVLNCHDNNITIYKNHKGPKKSLENQQYYKKIIFN